MCWIEGFWAFYEWNLVHFCSFIKKNILGAQMKESIAKKRHKQHFWNNTPPFMICMNFVDSFELPPTLAPCMMMQIFKNLEFFFRSQKRSVGIVNEKTSCIFTLLQLFPLFYMSQSHVFWQHNVCPGYP
jgi:hypothetical protein